jgi:uncharacterized membrane protein
MALLIILRVILSVSANAIQKKLLLNRAGVTHTWILTYGIMLGPATLIALFHRSNMSSEFWRDILLGGGLDAIGNLAMVAALRATDISVFGPLNALRPVLALLFGFIFLGEHPSATGLTGIAITFVGGIILFTDRQPKSVVRGAAIWKALFLRTAGLSLGVVGAVFLKRAATTSTAEVTVAAWIFCGLLVLLGFTMTRHRSDISGLGEALKMHRPWLLFHAGVFISMQWLTIRIFQTTLLAYSFVFFQLGMVLQVFAGRIFFNEPSFFRRLIAAIIMAGGSALILWKG